MSGGEHICAPSRPLLFQLSVKDAFNKLTTKEQLYAHYMARLEDTLAFWYQQPWLSYSRAAWHGTQIIHQQVSPESGPVYDFIIELYRSCGDDWQSLARQTGVEMSELADFLEYAAVFLANVGSYYMSHCQRSELVVLPVD